MGQGKIHLLPSPISDQWEDFISPGVRTLTAELKHFAIESHREARRFIRLMHPEKNFDECEFYLLNEHTDPSEISMMLKPCQAGHDLGLLSDAGCPGIADPGADLVRLAQDKGIQVIPHAGPSSIFMALMASGMNGQTFTFHGYLPKDRKARIQKIREFEKTVAKTGGSQIFMDTPYRNDHVLEDLIKFGHPESRLCIAQNVSGAKGWIRSKSLAQWKNGIPSLKKIPVIFILGT